MIQTRVNIQRQRSEWKRRDTVERALPSLLARPVNATLAVETGVLSAFSG